MAGRSGTTQHSLLIKARRKAARAAVAAYHGASLAEIQDRVREAPARAEVGELDAFEVDELIDRYTQAARELWKTCAMSPSNVESVAWMLRDMAERGETIDWWEARAPRRRRR